MLAFFEKGISFFIGLLAWITKKLGVSKILLPVQYAVTTLYWIFIMASIMASINFLLKFWTQLKILVDSYNTLGLSVSGTSYGISNATLVSSFWGFVHESGLDDAIMTSFGLFISFATAYFSIQTYKILRYVFDKLYIFLVDLIRNHLI